MSAWEDYGPAEFDRRRMPRGAKVAPREQAGLFVIAREPASPPVRASREELPGQGDLLEMFPAEGESDCLEFQ